MYRFFFKRMIDILVSIIGLVIISPILILFLILVSIQNKGNPLFFQIRPGLNQKPFKIIKLKTMLDKRDSNNNLLPDIERITFIGDFLRKFSIDEFPQLLNVLKGDMSLVGPRPLLFKYIPLYTKEQLKRHDVRPGITGWAQINGRNSLSWNQKFKLDIEYVENISFFFDFKIILLTFKKVILREGINQSKERPMQPYNGKN